MDLVLPSGISAILSMVLPYFISLINEKVKAKKLRYIIALAMSSILGIIVTLTTNGFDFTDATAFYASAITAATFSQLIYTMFWRGKILARLAAKKSK